MLFVTKRKLIKQLAEELAYLQIRADWWFYVSHLKEKQDMSSRELEAVTELRCICIHLGLPLNKIYKTAYKIYDFSNSGKPNFEPDIELIEKLDREFCEPRKKKRPLL